MSLRWTRAGLGAGALMLGLLVVTATAQEKADKVDAAAIFKARCSMCHGPTGDSKLPGMSFAALEHDPKVKDIYRDVIVGKAGYPQLIKQAKRSIYYIIRDKLSGKTEA